jgi:hypothetical protein
MEREKHKNFLNPQQACWWKLNGKDFVSAGCDFAPPHNPGIHRVLPRKKILHIRTCRPTLTNFPSWWGPHLHLLQTFTKLPQHRCPCANGGRGGGHAVDPGKACGGGSGDWPRGVACATEVQIPHLSLPIFCISLISSSLGYSAPIKVWRRRRWATPPDEGVWRQRWQRPSSWPAQQIPSEGAQRRRAMRTPAPWRIPAANALPQISRSSGFWRGRVTVAPRRGPRSGGSRRAVSSRECRSRVLTDPCRWVPATASLWWDPAAAPPRPT